MSRSRVCTYRESEGVARVQVHVTAAPSNKRAIQMDGAEREVVVWWRLVPGNCRTRREVEVGCQ